MNTLLKAAAVVTSSYLLATSASAALITEWSFDTTGGFVTAGPGAPVFTADTSPGAVPASTTVTATELSWGRDGVDITAPASSDSRENRSGLRLDGANIVGGTIFTNQAPTNTGVITHYNNTIRSFFPTLVSATIETTLTLTPSVPAGAPLDPIERVVPFRFIETPNRENCGFTSTSNCDDFFVIAIEDLQDTFVIDGIQYTSFVLPLGLAPLEESQCELVGLTECAGLRTLEDEANRFQLAIGIVAREIPAPATLGLLGLGLIAAGAVRRKK